MKSGGQKYNIEKFIVHEKFHLPSIANDIAVIKVLGEIAFNKMVQPIKYSAEKVPAGTIAQVTGWGLLSVS